MLPILKVVCNFGYRQKNDSQDCIPVGPTLPAKPSE